MHEVKWFLTHLGNVTTAICTAIVGYFAPIGGVVTIMVTAIVLDQLFGLIAARKRGEGILPDKLWRTGKKLFYAVVIVACLFVMDTELAVIELHRFVAFLITGWEMWSIAGSAAFITDHEIFTIIQQYMKDRTKEVTGIDISDQGDENGEL